MKSVAILVEGYGDVTALPALLGKVGQHIGEAIVAPNPIRSGEWKLLSRPGEFERKLDLAASRQCDLILVALDLDDDCAATQSRGAHGRIEAWKNGRNIEVQVVFFVREYEVLFLNCLKEVAPAAGVNMLDRAHEIRGAKEKLREIIGRRYRETQDQLDFTKKLDVRALYSRDRSFRRLCRALTGKDYNEIDLLFV